LTTTKLDFIERLFSDIGLNRREGKEVIELFFEQIKGKLEAGEGVRISKFGKFELIDKKKRPGKNPVSGEYVSVSARRVVTFYASNILKNRVISPLNTIGK
jgi:integration host factor subunit alpha